MSDLLSANLKKSRERGDLRYLAHEMQVTTKQVGRYWDKGWIEGSYSTPKGHRRIRYTDDTVERIKQIVKGAKATNIEIRYNTPEHTYEGTTIPLKGCNNMQDVERRARKARLSKQQAKHVAYQPRSSSSKLTSLNPNLVLEFLFAMNGTSLEEVIKRMNDLSFVPASYLYAGHDAVVLTTESLASWQPRHHQRDEAVLDKEFRDRSADEWKICLFRIEASAGRVDFTGSTPDVQKLRRKLMQILKQNRKKYLHPFFHQLNRDAFLALYNKEAELDSRITQRDEREGDEEKEREEREEFENRERFESREELEKERKEREKKTKEREDREMEMKYRKIQADAVENRAAMLLTIAEYSLKQKQENQEKTSAAKLAQWLGISRPALYRAYGAKKIRYVLNSIKNYGIAISATQTKGNNSKWVTM